MEKHCKLVEKAKAEIDNFYQQYNKKLSQAATKYIFFICSSNPQVDTSYLGAGKNFWCGVYAKAHKAEMLLNASNFKVTKENSKFKKLLKELSEEKAPPYV